MTGGWPIRVGRGCGRALAWACSGWTRTPSLPSPIARELRLLPLVEALCGGRRVTQLANVLVGLDPPPLALVLAAFAQAAQGSRAVALYAFGGDPRALTRYRVVWPKDDLDEPVTPLLRV